MFEALYKSPWHQPYAFWILQVLFIVLVVVRPPTGGWRWAALLVVGTIVAALDAGLTAEASPFGATAGPVFAIVGDWRFFFLVFVGAQFSRTWGVAAGLALALAFVIPVSVYSAQRNGTVAAGRPMFLLYEQIMTAFTGLILVSILSRLRGKKLMPTTRAVIALCVFWIVMYGLWATADTIILRGLDVGYGLRVIPNALYYVAFWPVVYLTFAANANATPTPKETAR